MPFCDPVERVSYAVYKSHCFLQVLYQHSHLGCFGDCHVDSHYANVVNTT